jgi:hypothetical protein
VTAQQRGALALMRRWRLLPEDLDRAADVLGVDRLTEAEAALQIS